MESYIGANPRTHGEYLRGEIAPLAMKILLNMLSNLNDSDIADMVRLWKLKQNEGKNNDYII